MLEQLLSAAPQNALPALAVIAFLSCLGVPIPASLMMLAAGAATAAGHLQAVPVVAACYLGAVGGDLSGYGLGRWGGRPLWARLESRPRSARLMRRARDQLQARAVASVFLSRWLFSALAPWVNLAAGATAIDQRLFAAWALAGRTIWVGGYVGLGIAFSDQIAVIGSTMVSMVGVLCAAALVAVFGRILWRRARN